MFKFMGLILLCVASTLAAAQIQPETFVIQAGQKGREATIKIPVGAVAAFSANAAEALVAHSGPQVEVMRLSGDVLISVVGANQPIQIKADDVVLELTADETPARAKLDWLLRRPTHRLQSTTVIADGGDTRTFVGNVVFTVQTSAGAMQIKADRIERKVGAAAGA